MELELNKKAEIYIPYGKTKEEAFKRTTVLAISAHEDDIELFAAAPIVECLHSQDKWFSGVVSTDGANSPRSGAYANCSSEEMIRIRAEEQKEAARVGRYSFMGLLNYSSAEVKDPSNRSPIEDYKKLIRASHPKIIYTHNLADKHDTHVATVIKVLTALRELPPNERPQKVYGCEVWRDLDWLMDEDKVILNIQGEEKLTSYLIDLFKSQIEGGKAYGEAIRGRRKANATFSASHAVDSYKEINYAMDLTPLMENKELDLFEYVDSYLERTREDIKKRIFTMEGK
ncbi:MAG: PIG-L family deacetylase [Bacilli bacterium]|jgi:LmbE family N-acetylglucosaminyl deacetylase|nr:PIG-L family deacetylase [Bacilli bacterium]